MTETLTYVKSTKNTFVYANETLSIYLPKDHAVFRGLPQAPIAITLQITAQP